MALCSQCGLWQQGKGDSQQHCVGLGLFLFWCKVSITGDVARQTSTGASTMEPSLPLGLVNSVRNSISKAGSSYTAQHGKFNTTIA